MRDQAACSAASASLRGPIGESMASTCGANTVSTARPLTATPVAPAGCSVSCTLTEFMLCVCAATAAWCYRHVRATRCATFHVAPRESQPLASPESQDDGFVFVDFDDGAGAATDSVAGGDHSSVAASQASSGAAPSTADRATPGNAGNASSQALRPAPSVEVSTAHSLWHGLWMVFGVNPMCPRTLYCKSPPCTTCRR